MNMRCVRFRWVATIAALFAVPAWAHCGHCGVGEETKGEGKDAKAEAHGEGHDHAHAEIGKPAPDFALKDQEGREHKLSDLKGKIVVLEWTNHECPVVNRYYSSKTIPNTYAKIKDQGVVWMAIDSSHFCQDKVESIRKWAEKQTLAYPILMDPDGKVGHLYAAKTTPHVFVIDAKGMLAYMGSVDDDREGDKEDARNYVEEAVTALAGGTAVAVNTTKPFGCSVKYKKD